MIVRTLILAAAAAALSACGQGGPAEGVAGATQVRITAAQFAQLRTGMTEAEVRAVIGDACEDEFDTAYDGSQVLGLITCNNERSVVFIVFDRNGVATQVNSAGVLP